MVVRWAVILFIIVGSGVVAAQPDDVCTYTYFDDGGVSSSRCLHDEGTWGTVRVYNRSGEVIGEWGMLLIPRVSNVELSFHPDGAVRRVRYSSQPDGGIQWYRSTTTYDSAGTVIGVEEEAWDMHERIRTCSAR